MTAYVLVNRIIHDREAMQAFSAQVPALVEEAGGRFLIRGGKPTVVEGGAFPLEYVTIIEFPSQQEAERLFASPEYQRVRQLGDAASATQMAILTVGI